MGGWLSKAGSGVRWRSVGYVGCGLSVTGSDNELSQDVLPGVDGIEHNSFQESMSGTNYTYWLN